MLQRQARADAPRPDPSRSRTRLRDAAALAGSRRSVVVSFVVALVLLVAVAVAAAFVSYRIADKEVSEDAAQTARRLAESGIGPPLVGALRGDPSARADLDAAVAARMADGTVSQVTIWTPDGVVLYSSNTSLVGRRALTDAPYRAAIARGVVSEIDRTDREFGEVPRAERVVQVLVPIPAVDNRLVLELHYNTDELAGQVLVVALPLAALAILPLLLLQLVQVPVVLSMLRRVRGYERERTELAEYALTASERERRDIAAGVHDRVVQDLAGASYAFSAIERHVDASHRATAQSALETVRASVEALRGLLTELYPATLTATGLPAAIENLLEASRRVGLRVADDLPEPGDLVDVDDDVAVLLYRVAREALANVTDHAVARCIELTLRTAGERIVLSVVDDGVGLPVSGPEGMSRPDAPGGLALLGGRVGDAGGVLTVQDCPRGGTRTEVDLPHRPALTARS